MRSINRSRYGEPARLLIEAAFAAGRPLALAFEGAADEARAALERIDAAGIVGAHAARDAGAADGLRGGLWLLHDFMDQAHGIVQDIDGTGGAYWHAIVHRREPDAHNSSYWYARVGEHPIFDELARDAAEIVAGQPDLAGIVAGGRFHWRRFVDLATSDPSGPARAALLSLQRREWELLFDHEFTRCCAGPRPRR